MTAYEKWERRYKPITAPEIQQAFNRDSFNAFSLEFKLRMLFQSAFEAGYRRGLSKSKTETRNEDQNK